MTPELGQDVSSHARLSVHPLEMLIYSVLHTGGNGSSSRAILASIMTPHTLDKFSCTSFASAVYITLLAREDVVYAVIFWRFQ